ncbi:MAG: VanW family protein [Defluviitaleaceae bacterium]|nr:VanW family protein [Defluviitaleaceae bacterium]
MEKIYKDILEPKTRNPLRLKLGVAFHRLKRRVKWAFGGYKFAKVSNEELQHQHFVHQTPLLRHLAGVPMELEQNKITNLRLALEKMNKVVINPGETLSFWKLIGKPTVRKGYLEGVVLRGGNFYSGLGGGLCHLSGFLYWMTLHTPLKITERHRHGYDTTPNKFFGSDATCFYNYKDLMIENPTSQPFQLILEIKDDHLQGAWQSSSAPKLAYEIYEKNSVYHIQSWGGKTRHNHVYRRVFDLEGKEIGDEFVAENHAIVMGDKTLDN